MSVVKVRTGTIYKGNTVENENGNETKGVEDLGVSPAIQPLIVGMINESAAPPPLCPIPVQRVAKGVMRATLGMSKNI